MEERFIKLTNAVYKVLEFFPEADPLKNKAKEKALVIMENLSLVFGTQGWASMQKESAKSRLSEDIDLLLSYLKIAQKQGWLSPINCFIISNEYEKFKKEMGPVIPVILPQPAKASSEPVLLNDGRRASASLRRASASLSERQEKILKFLEERQKAQVSDMQTVLPDVTKRTIRRDLDELLKMGKIDRTGEWNQVYYVLS